MAGGPCSRSTGIDDDAFRLALDLRKACFKGNTRLRLRFGVVDGKGRRWSVICRETVMGSEPLGIDKVGGWFPLLVDCMASVVTAWSK